MHKLLEFLVGHSSTIGLLITTLGAFFVALFKHKQLETQAKITQSFVVGLKEGLSTAAGGKDPATSIMAAVSAAAADFEVSDHVQTHLDQITKV